MRGLETQRRVVIPAAVEALEAQSGTRTPIRRVAGKGNKNSFHDLFYPIFAFSEFRSFALEGMQRHKNTGLICMPQIPGAWFG
jgi:hypothetical protein